MIDDPLLWTALGALVFTCLTAIGSRALRDFSRADLKEVCQRNGNSGRFSQIVLRHERVSLGVDMMGAFATSLFVVSAAYRGVGGLSLGNETTIDWRPVVGIGVIAGLALAMLRVGVSWSLTRLYGESFLYHTWPFWQLLSNVFAPLHWVTKLFDTAIHRLAGKEADMQDDESIEDEIKSIVSEGHREGLLEEDAREMIEGVIELSEDNVAHIMTPRTDMHMLQADLSWDELLADVTRAGHTRIPVYDNGRDDLIGILYVKDLLPELAKTNESDRISIRELVRKPKFVPETKAVDDLLTMFQQERTHIAIVLDEYGGVSGLVTIEDVLEEIVGEIVDEYDDELVEEIRKVSDDSCEAIGKAHVDEINEVLSIELPEDQDFDTIAGFVFTHLGYVPNVGEHITWEENVRITVLKATGRRIEQVLIERLSTTAVESA